MERFFAIFFFTTFSAAISGDLGTNLLTGQECSICELDDKFNSQTNYTCFTMGLAGLTICTCPDGQYTMNSRCRLCDRPNICGSGENAYCSENPTANPPGYVCFCSNNQFTFNKPCSDLTTTTPKITTTTTNQPILKPYDSLISFSTIMSVTENGTVAERSHTSSYGTGAGATGAIFRAVGIHQVRFRIERMYLNRTMFIGVYSPNVYDNFPCISDTKSTIGTPYYYSSGWYYCYIAASGWFGNSSIAVRGLTFDSSKPAGSEYTGDYEQYYTTNDVVTLTINCEEATLTLKNERTNKEYHLFIDHVQSDFGRLPWKLYINLYYPGDKIRFLPLKDN